MPNGVAQVDNELRFVLKDQSPIEITNARLVYRASARDEFVSLLLDGQGEEMALCHLNLLHALPNSQLVEATL